MADVLAHAGRTLKLDGELADCTPLLPAQLLTHAWQAVTARKAQAFRAQVDRLVRTLSDVLRAAWVRSAAGQAADSLRAAVGGAHADAFDFDAMSRLVTRSAPRQDLPPARRARIEATLAVLRAQPFYPGSSAPAGSESALPFAFSNCAAAIAAYRTRLPQLVAVVKALAIAELECKGRYNEAEHDPFFARYSERMLTADDLALFPDYFVCIPADRNDAPENAGLIGLLSSGLPVKIVVQADELIDDGVIGAAPLAFGVRPARLATTAMGLGGMFVLQAPASALPSLRPRIERGLTCHGPALFCVYPGLRAAESDLPPYLTAAAALEARLFPAFCYDAGAGPNWATRFSLEGNREPAADWVSERIDYADDRLQRASETMAFTPADFALADRTQAAQFAIVPRERFNPALLPVAHWLALDERDAAARIPYLLAVDREHRLQRVIVAAPLMQAARRALLLWHRLQEHAGINDSHAQRQLAEQRARLEAEWAAQRAALVPVPAAATAASAGPATDAPAGPAVEAAAEPARSPDEAWIETARCPSCNECQTINPRMFAYNDNKQAYIKDLGAGSFRQLVEAAEACQVAIIHPGKPRDPNEPGLEELIERARPFQ